ncbi:MAG: ABA4-like family protein [Cyclobacteriaceae bacterium]|jgi:hypothetical protein
MTLETLFSLCNALALPAWLLLAVAPRWRFTNLVVHSGAWPLVYAVIYTALILYYFGQGEGGFGSLAGVMKLFDQPGAVMAGWVHYLAFDLFIGSWEVRNAKKHNIPHWLVVPCLFFTFMFGPIGLLLYILLRTAFTFKLNVGHA